MTYITVLQLIVTPILLTLIYVYALAKIIRDEKTATRISIESLIITFFYLISMLMTFTVPQLNTIDLLQLMLTLALVVATGIYAWDTHKMAEEMKNTRFAALRPIIEIDWAPGERGRAFSPYFNNIGLGPALNVKFYCTHTSFEFKSKQDRVTLGVGKREHITLLSEDFDFKD